MKRTIVVILCLVCILFAFLYFNIRQTDNITTVKFSSWGSQSETEVVKKAINEFENQKEK